MESTTYIHPHYGPVRELFLQSFYPRDALHSAVYAVERCPSVRLSVRHTPVVGKGQYHDILMYAN